MSEENKKVDMKGLSNEEIILVFYRFNKYLTSLNENLDKKVMSKSVDTPFGNGVAIISIPEDHVQKFKESQYFELVNSVVNKLKPIVELIEECSPELKKLADEVK